MKGVTQMFDSIFTVDPTTDTFTLTYALTTIFTAFLSGVIISLTYMATSNRAHSTNFALTLIIVPSVVAIIIMLIGNNIARAFSLAGAFAIIRFRSAPGDPKNIAYVLFTMAAGLSCGVGMHLFSLFFTTVLCGLMFLLHVIRFGKNKTKRKLLKITVPENLSYEEAFQEVFKHFDITFELKTMRTRDLGSMFELEYVVHLNQDTDLKQFLDALRVRNGNLDIALQMNAADLDFRY
jgi:hypothetical protein